ncbi:metal ABC transporter substrate-binding protein [Haloferacaceae archaeon DSL9]
MELTRRSLLRGGAGAASLGALAGCLTEPDDGDSTDGKSGYAAFFTLWDWAERVGGDAFEITNPVRVGEMGHGWEPDGDLARDVATTDAFVYLDTPEFSWAQTIAAQLEADYPAVSVIDGLRDIEPDQLLAWTVESTPRPDTAHDWDPDTVDVADFDVIDRATGEVTADFHIDHWHGGLPDVPLDGRIALGAVFTDAEGRVLPLGADEPFQFDAVLADGAPGDVVDIDSRGDHLELRGAKTGRTLVVFRLLHDGAVVWATDASLDVAVVESVDERPDDFYDPHVWVDPVLAQTVVETIAESFSAIDPDREDAFAANTETYIDRLAEIDAAFVDLVETADRDTAVFAGHDSFRYLEHRYGFHLHTPQGVSPDDSPSQRDIGETIDLVNELGTETILYDPFETPDPETDIPALAETIVENSDATEVAPLTPVEGTTREWDERGWGWLEQMTQINLPSLRAALGAD